MEALRNVITFPVHDEKLACNRPHPVSTSSATAFFHVFKRKRSDSHGAVALCHDEVSSVKRQKIDTAVTVPSHSMTPPVSAVSSPATTPVSIEHPKNQVATKPLEVTVPLPPATVAAGATSCDEQVAPAPSVSKRDRAIQKIESVINYEILVRHDELRLIDLEMAKIQVALEQIRRCKRIPYPGELGASATAYQASTGEGAPLEPAPGFSRPQYPSAFGVVDGPYTRHYQHWLLPDSKFDSVPLDSLAPACSTRSYFPNRMFGERASFAASRSGRHSIGGPHQALPSNYPMPKAQAGPLIIKRMSDGKMVKLVCVWCQKENISSVQGFLNHCRIAHGEGFASHEQAAQRCGQPIDEDQSTVATPAATPNVPATPAVQTPVAQMQGAPTPIITAGNPLVHPLNLTKEKRSLDQAAAFVNSIHAQPSTAPKPVKAATAAHSRPRPLALNIPNATNSSFVPSQQAPRLSALFKKTGVNVDLSKFVDDAKQRCNIDDIVPLVQEDAETPSKPSAKPVARTIASQQSKIPTQGQNVFRLPQGPTSQKHAGIPDTSVTVFEDTPASSFHGSTAPHSPGSPSDIGMLHSPEFGLSPNDLNPGLMTDNEEDGYSETPSEVSDTEDIHNHRHRHLQVQVRTASDAYEHHVVAGAEEGEAGSLPCMFQSSQQGGCQDSCQDAFDTSAHGAGQKRKRGRPSKASQSKVKGG